jgi:hypothetical protein
VASYVVENLPNFDPHISKKQRIQTKHKQRWTKARSKNKLEWKVHKGVWYCTLL